LMSPTGRQRPEGVTMFECFTNDGEDVVVILTLIDDGAWIVADWADTGESETLTLEAAEALAAASDLVDIHTAVSELVPMAREQRRRACYP